MPIESTYQQPLFILYKYIHLLLFLFPQLIHRTYQLRYVLHYFFDTYFLSYLCTSLGLFTVAIFGSFLWSFWSHFQFHFQKMNLKMRPKLDEKWSFLENWTMPSFLRKWPFSRSFSLFQCRFKLRSNTNQIQTTIANAKTTVATPAAAGLEMQHVSGRYFFFLFSILN